MAEPTGIETPRLVLRQWCDSDRARLGLDEAVSFTALRNVRSQWESGRGV